MADRLIRPPSVVSFRERLPRDALPIADLLGDALLLRLLEAHGGTRLSVPGRITSHEPLSVLLGLRPAQRLVGEYGGTAITLQLCKPWRAHMLRREGLTYAAIARRLGMHEQSIYRLLNQTDRRAAFERRRLDQLQLDLEPAPVNTR